MALNPATTQRLVHVAQAAATAPTPESRKVTDFLTVSFKGREFNVRGVPGVMVGERLQITFNPWVPDAAMVVDRDADGNEEPLAQHHRSRCTHRLARRLVQIPHH